MSNFVNVVPVEAGSKLRHPVSGVLSDSGGPWLADQFTFRLIGEGVIERARVVAPAVAPAPVVASAALPAAAVAPLAASVAAKSVS